MSKCRPKEYRACGRPQTHCDFRSIPAPDIPESRRASHRLSDKDACDWGSPKTQHKDGTPGGRRKDQGCGVSLSSLSFKSAGSQAGRRARATLCTQGRNLVVVKFCSFFKIRVEQGSTGCNSTAKNTKCTKARVRRHSRCCSFLFFFLREGGGRAGGKGERAFQAGSRPCSEPDAGLDLTTPRP